MLLNYLSLQMFADDMAADAQFATEPEGTDVEGSTTTTDEPSQDVNVDKPSFDELIKGDYKADYEAKLKGALDKRFKNQADLQGKLDSQAPVISLLANKYGIEAVNGQYDIQKLLETIENDDAMYEKEAFDRGIDISTLKEMKKLERKNQELESLQENQRRQEAFNQFIADAQAVKNTYPSFDLDSEMLNPDFTRLIDVGVPVQTAYEVVHRDEVISQGMKYAAEKTKQNLSRSIQGGNRPQENGMASNSSTNLGAIDITKLNRKELEDIKRRAQAGEMITFV